MGAGRDPPRAVGMRPLGLTFSPDGRWLAARCLGEQGGVVWDLDSQQRVASLAVNKSWINGLTFSADSRYLATTLNDATVRLWTAPRWRCRVVLRSDLEGVLLCPAFSDDGRWLVATCSDKVDHTVVWDMTTRLQHTLIRGSGDNAAIANWKAGHSFLAIRIGLDTYVRRARDGRTVAVFPGRCTTAGADGRTWAGGDGNHVGLYRIEGCDTPEEALLLALWGTGDLSLLSRDR